MKNPDTHPNEFCRVQAGETVREGAMYRTAFQWEKAISSVGQKITHVMPNTPLYNPVSWPVPNTTMKNPDTHPNEFRLVREGETVLPIAVYKNIISGQWQRASASVGRQAQRTCNGFPLYHPIEAPPVNRDPAKYNPDTHPQDFHAVVKGEIVLPTAVFRPDKGGWKRADWSIGRERTHTSYGKQIYNPNTLIVDTTTSVPPEKPIERQTNTMLLRTTIMHTPKVVPGSIPATEEVLIPSTETAAPDGNVALLLLGADNAALVKKAAKTSTMRIIQSAH